MHCQSYLQLCMAKDDISRTHTYGDKQPAINPFTTRRPFPEPGLNDQVRLWVEVRCVNAVINEDITLGGKLGFC